MKKILVTGANGFVGSHVVKELLAHDYEVVALHREQADTTALEGLECQLVSGDIKDVVSLERAFEGVDTVIHIAALFRQAKFPDSEYVAVNVEGTRNVFETAIKMGIKRVIHCSTVGVHSHIPNPPASEGEAFRPGDIYQETKLDGEKVARSYLANGQINGAVIRPAMIWGPGDTRTLKLFKGIAARKFPVIGDGKTLLHWILVTDLARAFRMLAEREDINNEVFIIAGDRAVPLKYLVETIAECFGVRPIPIKIPALPVQLLGDAVELVCKPFGIEPPIYRRRVDFFTKTRSFNTKKAQTELGFVPEHSFEEEVGLIVRWYLNHGWITPAHPRTESGTGADFQEKNP